MFASSVALLLAFLSSGFAAPVESCLEEAGGVCRSSENALDTDLELLPPQVEEEETLEANVMLLQTNFQHPRLEALAKAQLSQNAPTSQLSVAVSADAEAVQDSNASKAAPAEAGNASKVALLEQEANASLSSAGAAGAAAMSVAASAFTEQAAVASPAAAAAAAAEEPPRVEASPSQTAARAALAAADAAAAAAVLAERVAAKLMEGQAAAVPATLAQTKQAEKPDRVWPFGDVMSGIKDFFPGVAERVVDGAATAAAQAAAESFASVINTTLNALDEKANSLVSFCASYKDDILQNVSRSGDRKIESFQAMVVTHIGTVEERWSFIVDTTAAAGPHLVRAVSGMGLTSLASEAQGGLDRTLALAHHITNVFHNASAITARMGGRSKKELAGIVSELNQTISSGLEAVTAFADESVQLIQKVIAGAAEKLGVSLLAEVSEPMDRFPSPDAIKGTFTSLLQEASDTISKISAGMSDYFAGTLEAAKMVIDDSDLKGSAFGARSLSSLVIMLALLGASVN